MAPRTRKTERRTDALTRERIIETAVELLDTAGEGGLTFRVLTERLATGPGAIYHHVANKSELLDAATDAVVAKALHVPPASADAPDATDATAHAPAHPAAREAAHDGIRAVALGLYEAIDEHPWLATQLALQLSRNPQQSVAPRILESIGQQVTALGVPQADWFTAASALMHYILGAAGLNAANGRAFGAHANREEFLHATSRAWKDLDPDDYPFTRAVADQMRRHDDRTQFLDGLAFILAGITAPHPPATA